MKMSPKNDDQTPYLLEILLELNWVSHHCDLVTFILVQDVYICCFFCTKMLLLCTMKMWAYCTF